MKQTYKNDIQNQEELDNYIDLMTAKNELDKKTRINLYLPKIIVKIIDSLAKDKSRGELVSTLVLKEAKKKQKTLYGTFSPLEISEKEIDEISSQWDRKINEPA